MAKGQKRSNREVRKAPQAKPKPAVVTVGSGKPSPMATLGRTKT
jgi:hypothetical protein